MGNYRKFWTPWEIRLRCGKRPGNPAEVERIANRLARAAKESFLDHMKKIEDREKRDAEKKEAPRRARLLKVAQLVLKGYREKEIANIFDVSISRAHQLIHDPIVVEALLQKTLATEYPKTYEDVMNEK